MKENGLKSCDLHAYHFFSLVNLLSIIRFNYRNVNFSLIVNALIYMIKDSHNMMMRMVMVHGDDGVLA